MPPDSLKKLTPNKYVAIVAGICFAASLAIVVPAYAAAPALSCVKDGSLTATCVLTGDNPSGFTAKLVECDGLGADCQTYAGPFLYDCGADNPYVCNHQVTLSQGAHLIKAVRFDNQVLATDTNGAQTYGGGLDSTNIGAGLVSALGTFGTSYGPVLLAALAIALGLFGLKLSLNWSRKLVRAKEARSRRKRLDRST